MNQIIDRLSVMRPWLGQDEIDALTEVIASGWIAQGVQPSAEFAAGQAEVPT